MADEAGGPGDPGNRSAEEAAFTARLRRLGERLDHERASHPSDTSSGVTPTTDGSGLARGLRLSSELVAGVLVGAVVGWALDRWVGISPWGLIVFVLLGFAAGVRNVIRAAGTSVGNTSDNRGHRP